MKLFRLLLVLVILLMLASESFAGPIVRFFQHRAEVRQARIASGGGLPIARQFTLFGVPTAAKSTSGCTNCGCTAAPAAAVPKEMPKKK